MRHLSLILSLLWATAAFASVRYDASLGYNVVEIDGETYHTGYKPELAPKKSVHYFPPYLGAFAGVEPPEELDYRQYAGPVFNQKCGDCWAQGAKSAFEGVVALRDGKSIDISAQHIIDCSGFGSCNGGYISVDVFKKLGAVYSSEYPYKGVTQKCKYTGPYHEKATATGTVNLTWADMKRALMEMGPMEVCGSSSSLGNGGWVEKNGGGPVDHCYAIFGWLRGEKHGHKAGDYAIIKNSWSEKWGDAGWGFYLMGDWKGNVITEASFTDYKAACTPQPKADAGPDLHVVLQ